MHAHAVRLLLLMIITLISTNLMGLIQLTLPYGPVDSYMALIPCMEQLDLIDHGSAGLGCSKAAHGMYY